MIRIMSGVDPAPDEAGHGPIDDAEEGGGGGGHETDDERVLAPEHQTSQDVEAGRVGAQGMPVGRRAGGQKLLWLVELRACWAFTWLVWYSSGPTKQKSTMKMMTADPITASLFSMKTRSDLPQSSSRAGRHHHPRDRRWTGEARPPAWRPRAWPGRGNGSAQGE